MAETKNPQDVAQALAKLMPRKVGAFIRKGNRVAITVQDVTAFGTIITACTGTCAGGMSVLVTLDGTDQQVWVPSANLRDEEKV